MIDGQWRVIGDDVEGTVEWCRGMKDELAAQRMAKRFSEMFPCVTFEAIEVKGAWKDGHAVQQDTECG
jgi:hypothetical protein